MILADAVQPLLLGMDWMDPTWLMDRFGDALLWITMLIVFVECGLFFPLLPGESLLVAVGVFIAGETIDVFPGTPLMELLLTLALVTVAAFLGNISGYEIGRAVGPALYARDGRFVKKKHLDQAAAFFDKHGSKALVLGRFVPFVRTYVTVIAGVTRMDRHRFVFWSFIGAAMWVVGGTVLGYSLGNRFPWLRENIDLAVVLILVLSMLPIGVEWWRHKRTAGQAAESAETRLP